MQFDPLNTMVLTKSEKELLKRLDPLFFKLLHEECIPFTFSYLDGRQIKTLGSSRAKLKMDQEFRDNSSWMKAFKKDEKELLREIDAGSEDDNPNVISKEQDFLPMSVKYLNMKEMQAWIGARARTEMTRRYGEKHGLQFRWGDASCEPEYWDEEMCEWRLMVNPRQHNKSEYKGKGNMTECLRHQIEKFFEFYNLNINDFTIKGSEAEKRRIQNDKNKKTDSAADDDNEATTTNQPDPTAAASDDDASLDNSDGAGDSDKSTNSVAIQSQSQSTSSRLQRQRTISPSQRQPSPQSPSRPLSPPRNRRSPTLSSRSPSQSPPRTRRSLSKTPSLSPSTSQQGFSRKRKNTNIKTSTIRDGSQKKKKKKISNQISLSPIRIQGNFRPLPHVPMDSTDSSTLASTNSRTTRNNGIVKKRYTKYK